MVTTHSPYIISSFNNLLQAGIILDKEIVSADKLNEVFNNLFAIPPKTLNSYALENNNCKSIIDSEYDLIDSTYLDEISDIISNDFDNLLSLE